LPGHFNTHYKISQFYWRTYSIGVWLKVRRWFFYRCHHRRITSVSFSFVGDSPFHRYISRKTKKPFADGFTNGICAPKKKFPAWNIPTDFHSVGDIVIDRWLLSVGKTVGECMTYRPNIYVCKFIGNCDNYCQKLTDYVRRESCWWVFEILTECIRRWMCRWMLLSDSDGLISSVKPLVIVFFPEFVFKKLFRIYKIKLYKLMVIQTNYANKIFIKHKKNQS